jgi:[acyl-carrier-protein] S-malonyltransferase
MTNVALIFPGQGAQKVGMGREFYEGSAEAKAIFDQAEAVAGNNFKQVVFEGPQETLTSTAYSQPAILTMSLAALAAFKAHPKFKNINVQFAAGLSLGEYSALCAAGVLTFDDTLKLVQKRGAFMEEAAKQAKGAMAAVIGFDAAKLKEICQTTGAEVANFNSLEQIVITGHADKVAAACELIKAAGARTVIPLEVSGAFHSTLMRPAAVKFEGAVASVPITPGNINVISNVNAQPHTIPTEIRKNLVAQITSSVQWVASVQFMMQNGIQDFIEIGPGKVLRGLIRKIDANARVVNIEKPGDIDQLPF